jgi:hypothetical protein
MKLRYLPIFLTIFVFSAAAAIPECHWTYLTGATDAETHATGIAMDDSNNMFMTGYTTGSLDGQPKMGTTDAFIKKHNSFGFTQWTKQLGVAGAETKANGVAVDWQGNVYITGYTTGNLDGKTNNRPKAAFVTKYNTNGEKQWTSLLSAGYGETVAKAISVDSSGNTYITGYTTGGTPTSYDPNYYFGFIAQFDINGNTNLSNLEKIGSWGAGKTVGLGITGGSLVMVTGSTDTAINGQSKISGAGYTDAFVLKYLPGTHTTQWTKLFGVAGANTVGTGIAKGETVTNEAGQAISYYYVTGFTNGNLGASPFNPTGNTVFVSKHGNAGKVEWTTQSGATNTETVGNAIVVDSASYSYVTGYTTGDLDGQPKAGRKDAFIIKYNSLGEKQGTKLLGAPDAGSDTIGQGIALDTSGNNYVVGTVTKGADPTVLDNQTLTASVEAFFTNEFNAVNVKKADFVISRFVIDRPKLFQGETPLTWVHVTIKNIGDLDVSLGSISCALVNVRHNGNLIASPIGTMPVSTYTAPLKPGQTADWSFPVGYNTLWPRGKYTFQMQVDSDNKVDESSEYNNFSNTISLEVFEHPTNFDIAYFWAPVIEQQMYWRWSDFFTTINYDGDWDATNNWKHLGESVENPRAAVYYSVVASESHWFILYGTYFPGDNDCLNSHEHDFEGFLLVVRRPWAWADPFSPEGMYGLPEAAIMQLHGPLYNYEVYDLCETRDCVHVLDKIMFNLWKFEGEDHYRPAVSQECCGHGMQPYPYMNDIFYTWCLYRDYEPSIVYHPSTKSITEITRPVIGNTQGEYALIDVFAERGLWYYRNDPYVFSTYGEFNPPGANAFWNWVGGTIATDPITLVKNSFTQYQQVTDPNYPYSTTYTSNPYIQ